MRRYLAVAILGFLVGSLGNAVAQEAQIGRIFTSDAGPANNINTGYGSAGCAVGDACDQAFALSANALVTIQCRDFPCVVAVGRVDNDAGIGTALPADGYIFTRTGPVVWNVLRPDAGLYTGAVITVSPTAGNSSARAFIHVRTGQE